MDAMDLVCLRKLLGMNLRVFPYHTQLRDYFREKKKVWDFFASESNRKEQLEQFKLDLLKQTYKFDPESEKLVYDLFEKACTLLGIQNIKPFFYQATYNEDTNANVVLLEDEIHIVFSGAMLKLLGEDELLSVIAHEVGHIWFNLTQNRDFEVCDRIVLAIANSSNQTDMAYYHSARFYRLYTELLCDRAAMEVCGSPDAVIRALVKSATGLENIQVSSYLKQAEELFKHARDLSSDGLSHPEMFIRVQALQWYAENKETADEKISTIIQGKKGLEMLDVFDQKVLSDLSHSILQLYLKPSWFRTTLILSHARQFFPDFAVKESLLLEDELLNVLEKQAPSVKEYLAYLLYDFVHLDPDLEEVPQGWAFEFAEAILVKDEFDALMKKETGFSEKKIKQLRESSLEAFAHVKQGKTDQIYTD